jgi:hypothetical protein
LHPNTNPQVNLILTMMMFGLNLPEVKWKESLESTTKNCTCCAEFGRQNPQSPTPIQISLCIPDISSPPLSKRLVYSKSNYRGDHKFFLLTPPQSNSSIHIAFRSRIMEHAQGHQYCIFLNFDNNIGEDGLSAQSMYEKNIDNSNYQNALCPNQKLLHKVTTSHPGVKKIYVSVVRVINDLLMQIDRNCNCSQYIMIC